MNTSTHMVRRLAVGLLMGALFGAFPAMAVERATPEVSLKKSSDCDIALESYASEGHGGSRAFMSREVKLDAGPTAAPAVKKKPISVRTSARSGATYTSIR